MGIHEAMELVDAHIFSGDALHDKENRDMLHDNLQRWGRELRRFDLLDDPIAHELSQGLGVNPEDLVDRIKEVHAKTNGFKNFDRQKQRLERFIKAAEDAEVLHLIGGELRP